MVRVHPFAEDAVVELKEKTFAMKEGSPYQMQFEFIVQRDIVTGLKYIQGTYRKGIRGVLLATTTASAGAPRRLCAPCVSTPRAQSVSAPFPECRKFDFC